MKEYKVVHIINNDKFANSFIKFIEKYFNDNEHLYIFLYGEDQEKFSIPQKNNVLNINNQYNKINNIVTLSKILTPYIKKADKVILHSIYTRNLIIYLFTHQKYLIKCYHVMWGGDFYFPEKQNWIKKQVIKNMGHFITYIHGDYKLAQKWYGAKGNYHECFMYPSNLYKEYDIKPKSHKTINIQVGNSADPTNNHLEVFEKLEKYKDDDIRIIVPLSYGNQEYAKEVIAQGQKIFGDKFEPLTEFMSFEKYLDLLAEIDIAIFNHNRQQAMGNTITLLGLGKKVFMRDDITPWKTFENIEVSVFNINNLTLDLLDEEIKQQNQQRIKEYFSKENYLKQLNKLFES